jgi:hypothetical protein
MASSPFGAGAGGLFSTPSPAAAQSSTGYVLEVLFGISVVGGRGYAYVYLLPNSEREFGFYRSWKGQWETEEE